MERIYTRFVHGQAQVASFVNTQLLETYWQIGQYIVEFEQAGSLKAEYGKRLLENLSKDLSALHGKGFSLSIVKQMRQFYGQ